MTAVDWGDFSPLRDELAGEDLRRVREGAGFGQDADEDFERWLAGVVGAAWHEYLDLFLARRVPTRFADLQQQRLHQLMVDAFTTRSATVDNVARLFQLTQQQARTLLRNTRTRYRFDLQPALARATWSVLRAAVHDPANDRYVVEVRDAHLLEYMDELIRQAPGYPRPLERHDDPHRYYASTTAVQAICEAIGKSADDLAKAT